MMMPVRSDSARPALAGLSGVRAVAAYAIIAAHAGFQSGRSLGNGSFAPLLSRLNVAVTLFFLLSGFLLSRQFFTDAGRLSPRQVGGFWWRRALRLFPAYWLAVIGTLLLLTHQRRTGADWLNYLSLTQTYDHHYSISALTQTWTLVVEVSFYAVLPLLILGSRRIRRPHGQQAAVLVGAMMVVAVASDLLIHGIGSGTSPALLWLPGYLDWFALGILLASVAVHPANTRWRRMLLDWSRAPGTCWLICALLIWMSTLPLAGPRGLAPATTWQWTFQHWLFGAASFFFLLPVTQAVGGWTETVLANRPMQWLGEISYGVYLWHLAFLAAIARWAGWLPFTGHFLALFAMTAVAATAVAAASWHLVEQPLLRRFSRSWRRPVVRDDAAKKHDADRHQAEQLNARTSGERVG
jgi:peptidoglycan/LPS O-acetylase OafA/YrhL